MNSAYLGQLFKKKYGVSFREYLNSRRIEEAAAVLRILEAAQESSREKRRVPLDR